MTIAEKVLTPEWLFKCAGITAAGTVQWRDPVPEQGSGVYVVTLIEPDGGDARVVYIGRTKHLRKRLAQFYRHRYGERSPHSGGQAILKLAGKMTVHWAAAADYATAERVMLDAFSGVTGVWPLGNRIKSAAMAPPSG